MPKENANCLLSALSAADGQLSPIQFSYDKQADDL